MTAPFDPAIIESHGWRQGAVLGPVLLKAARELAPATVAVDDADWLIITSHDCDVVNDILLKEPVVEVLRAQVIQRPGADKQQAGGRNPRTLQIAVNAENVVLSCKVHERWLLPREMLVIEAPAKQLDDKNRRLIAEWLAKRYIRAAFPTSFDGRWRSMLKAWTTLLATQSRWVQGVYLRLNTLAELPPETPYRCHVIVAVPAKARKGAGWADKRVEIDKTVKAFWAQFDPDIVFDGVEVLGTDELTLADIEAYQRFDADWVSFADDTDATPPAADMTV